MPVQKSRHAAKRDNHAPALILGAQMDRADRNASERAERPRHLAGPSSRDPPHCHETEARRHDSRCRGWRDRDRAHTPPSLPSPRPNCRPPGTRAEVLPPPRLGFWLEPSARHRDTPLVPRLWATRTSLCSSAFKNVFLFHQCGVQSLSQALACYICFPFIFFYFAFKDYAFLLGVCTIQKIHF